MSQNFAKSYKNFEGNINVKVFLIITQQNQITKMFHKLIPQVLH